MQYILTIYYNEKLLRNVKFIDKLYYSAKNYVI